MNLVSTIYLATTKVVTPDLSQHICDFCQTDRPVPGAAVESVVVIKLPMFDPLNPELWFVQCEAQFELKNVTVDQSKYYHVVASLDLVIQQRLKATLMSPPVAEKFNLKRSFWSCMDFWMNKKQKNFWMLVCWES